MNFREASEEIKAEIQPMLDNISEIRQSIEEYCWKRKNILEMAAFDQLRDVCGEDEVVAFWFRDWEEEMAIKINGEELDYMDERVLEITRHMENISVLSPMMIDKIIYTPTGVTFYGPEKD